MWQTIFIFNIDIIGNRDILLEYGYIKSEDSEQIEHIKPNIYYYILLYI